MVGQLDHSKEQEAMLEVYTDSAFASCPSGAKSTSGTMIVIKAGTFSFPIYWSSKKHKLVLLGVRLKLS